MRKQILINATTLFLEQGFGSLSLVKRRLKLSHSKGIEVMNKLEQLKIVSSKNGSKPRILLIKSINELKDKL